MPKKRNQPPPSASDIRRTIAEISARVTRALALNGQEEADAIIEASGGQQDFHKHLIDGQQAAIQALFASIPVRGNKRVREAFNKTLVITATLVHYAVALGIRYGREYERKHPGEAD